MTEVTEKPIDDKIQPVVRATNRDGWTAIEIFLPIAGDVMCLSAFARIEGNRLLEWTTQAPSCFPVFDSSNPLR